MKKKIVKVPIIHGYVEMPEEKYNRLVNNGELETYMQRYEPKTAIPTVSPLHGSSYITARVRTNHVL